MFIRSLSSSDARFKGVEFRAGLNILVADRTEVSVQGDSRNSVGKTSLVKILRYLLGGDLPPAFRAPELADHSFTASLELPSGAGDANEIVTVTRSVSPSTRVLVAGWSATAGEEDLHVDEWRRLLGSELFGLPENISTPTPGQLWAQLIRTYFGNPVKGHQSEADWISGVRLGYLLGLSPEILGQAGDIDRLSKQGKVLRSAVKEGAIAHIDLDEPGLRAQLAVARRRRDQTLVDLRSFRVDEQYSHHQIEADRLSGTIQQLNDEALALRRRLRELEDTLQSEAGSEAGSMADRLADVYGEIGIVMPEAVGRRYEEVEAFHESVIRNRRSFLQQELGEVRSRLTIVSEELDQRDGDRAEIMRLLNESVALDTFLTAQADLMDQEADVANLTRRLESAVSIAAINDSIKIRRAELVASVRTELSEREAPLGESISLFGELGAEVYSDREASLLVSPTSKGILKVEPHISGDASTGVRNVATFMLDMVSVVTALQGGRSPRLLVHDSHLFDAVDGRQVASCLNIGARLADEFEFQYIVTLNSDFLGSVEAQSDGAFDSTPYVLDTRLTDETDAGGLFGFRFE